MEYEKIKRIMDDMSESKLTSLEIDFPDGTKVRMKKDEVNAISNNLIKEEPKLEVTSNNVVPIKEVNEVEEDDSNIVKSPMVGTFYAKPSPDAEPYVKVGDTVKKGDILCIIEAMKLMNEIESEYDGVVTEILIEDGKPVDYGKPLFKIK